MRSPEEIHARLGSLFEEHERIGRELDSLSEAGCWPSEPCYMELCANLDVVTAQINMLCWVLSYNYNLKI